MEKINNQYDAINALKPYIGKGIHVEVRGNWVWVTGAIDAVKSDLVKIGYKYHANKNALYYHPGGYHKKSKRELPMAKIRVLYDGGEIC